VATVTFAVDVLVAAAYVPDAVLVAKAGDATINIARIAIIDTSRYLAFPFMFLLLLLLS